VMWRNVAKSALWFRSGSMFFSSCSFSRDVTFRHANFNIHLPENYWFTYVSSL
jgi:hypothetical protein